MKKNMSSQQMNIRCCADTNTMAGSWAIFRTCSPGFLRGYEVEPLTNTVMAFASALTVALRKAPEPDK